MCYCPPCARVCYVLLTDCLPLDSSFDNLQFDRALPGWRLPSRSAEHIAWCLIEAIVSVNAHPETSVFQFSGRCLDVRHAREHALSDADYIGGETIPVASELDSPVALLALE